MSEIDLHKEASVEPVSVAKPARSGLQRGDLIHRVTSSGERISTWRVGSISAPGSPWRLSLLNHQDTYTTIGRDVAGDYATDDGQRLDAPVRVKRPSYLLSTAHNLVGKHAVRSDGVGGPIRNMSLDKLNPWIIISTGSTLIRLTPESMGDWQLAGKRPRPLIEAAYGTKTISRSTLVGLLVKDTELNAYGAVQHFNPAAGTVSIWMLDGSEVWQHQDTLQAATWKVVGTDKHLTQVMNRTKEIGLPVARKAPLDARAILGSKDTAVIAGTLASLFITVPAMAMTPEAVLLGPVIGFGPYLTWKIKSHLRLRGVFKGESAQTQLPVLSTTSSVGTGLVNRLREQLRIELPSAQKKIATRILGTGSYLLTHLDTLEAPVRDETTALLLDHLPKALKLYAAAAEHQLSPAVRVEATELLNRQLSQIDAALDVTRAQIEGQVIRQLREHANFLDAKLRKSDLD